MEATERPAEFDVRRAAYSHAMLKPILDPRSIAIVGASPKPTTLGGRATRHVRRFAGPIHYVNPSYDCIDGHPCHPSVAALSGPVDCALLAVPHDRVEAALLDCAAAGVRGVVVVASGFAETGLADRIAAQARLVALAQSSGLRLIGPNCAGFAVAGRGIHVGFPEFHLGEENGAPRIGLVTQSGALGLALSQAAHAGIGFSHVLTSGNSADVDVADHVGFLADEPDCAAIAVVLEGVSDTGRLAQALERARHAGKPVAVCKTGSSVAGAAAALHHTGSVAGDPASYAGLFARTGAIAVERIETLVETTAFLAKAPRPTAPGIAILAGSGGAGIVAADSAERWNLSLPEPDAKIRKILEENIPAYGTRTNPCDLTAQVAANPDALLRCAEAFLADRRFGALAVPWGKAYASDAMAALSAAARRHGKALCLIWMSQWLEGPGAAVAAADPGIALFRSTDACFATLAAWNLRGRTAWNRTAPVAQ